MLFSLALYRETRIYSAFQSWCLKIYTKPLLIILTCFPYRLDIPQKWFLNFVCFSISRRAMAASGHFSKIQVCLFVHYTYPTSFFSFVLQTSKNQLGEYGGNQTNDFFFSNRWLKENVFLTLQHYGVCYDFVSTDDYVDRPPITISRLFRQSCIRVRSLFVDILFNIWATFSFGKSLAVVGCSAGVGRHKVPLLPAIFLYKLVTSVIAEKLCIVV